MDIDDPTAPPRDKGRAQDAHESGEADQFDAMNVEQRLHRGFELVAPGVNLMIDRRRRDARLPGEREAAGVAAIGEHQPDFGGKVGARAAAISAAMLEPRPEIKIAVRRRERSQAQTVPAWRRARRSAATSFAEPNRAQPVVGERPRRSIELLGGDESHHADPAIEGAQHFGLADRRRPRRAMPNTAGGAKASRSSRTARCVGRTRGRLSGKPPPVICASALTPSHGGDRLQQWLHIEPGRRQQGLSERAARART